MASTADSEGATRTAAAPDRSDRDQSREVARIAAFSDGVYAIAITLLALQLSIPSGHVDVWREVSKLSPSFVAFAISFAVIGAYWVSHHRLFAVVSRYDGRLIWLNLLSLFFIVLMPFTTSLIGEHGASRASVVIYVLSIAFAGLASTATAAYALLGHRLCRANVDDRVTKFYIWRGLVIALVFLGSLALLPLGPGITELAWLALIPLQWYVRRRFARPGQV